MDKNTAHTLLRSFVQRARATKEKTFATALEVDAIAALLGELPEGPPEAEGKAEREPVVAAVPDVVVPPLGPAQLVPPQDYMLCIDFGTSFSKALASRDTGSEVPEFFDIEIGGEQSPYLTPSELLIDEQTIYLGSAVRPRLFKTGASSDRLIDSVKQFITLERDLSLLTTRRLNENQDPRQQFTVREILLIYLAHLNWLTENALAEKGQSRDMMRRFTHPAWKKEFRDSNEREMRRLMAQAIALTRSLGEDLKSSLPVSRAHLALQKIGGLADADLPTHLVTDSIREATAAGSGALLSQREGSREPFLVLDIGAGTTDVAAFLSAKSALEGKGGIFEIADAANAINVAGNVLDDILRRMILDRVGLTRGSVEHNAAALELRRDIRAYKESLFADGSVAVSLPTDRAVEITLEEFLQDPRAQSTFQQIRELVTGSAIAAAGSADHINLVATGGGARLPLVQELAKKGVQRNGKRIGLRLQDAMPVEIEERYPNLRFVFPQIAVALGGSMPTLPEQRSDLDTGLTLAKRRQIGPTYKS